MNAEEYFQKLYLPIEEKLYNSSFDAPLYFLNSFDKINSVSFYIIGDSFISDKIYNDMEDLLFELRREITKKVLIQ